ncbi:cobamide remodeling phosphodiesterase CbiR [Breznakiella homolactica]|uniref:cobamide remodeling phosphodiesterase CbiR n=1 Tax=Breznakiella homolactica TaxID=2798577 RepID=UPI001CBA603C|nr:cobamide remodeling phosphodiesterase CbiR [Breznakiella homolactica]
MRNSPDCEVTVVLSVPSWVIPGTYGENLRFLADKAAVGNVELLFFICDAGVRDLLEEEFSIISGFKRRFSFTAHLPDEILPEHEDLIIRLRPLVRHFIVHPPKDPRRNRKTAELLVKWEERYRAAEDPGPGLFLIENTTLPRFESLMAELPETAGICMDTGHLLLESADPSAFFDAHRHRIGEIHLHGTDHAAARLDGKLPDHRALRRDTPWLEGFLPKIRDFSGITNIEVFSWKEAEESIALLEGNF